MPDMAVHYYNYLSGHSKAGAPQTFYENPEANVSDYFAPGESHPLGPDDGLGIGLSWEEPLWGVPPGDRRMVGSFGPVTLSPGEINFIDIAFVFQEGDPESMSATSENMNARLVEVKQYFNEWLTDCDITTPITGISERGVTEILEVFPNPASDRIQIRAREMGNVCIFNSAGQLLTHESIRNDSDEINISHLAPGIYHIRMNDSSTRFVKR
jgi:hypothetical protein